MWGKRGGRSVPSASDGALGCRRPAERPKAVFLDHEAESTAFLAEKIVETLVLADIDPLLPVAATLASLRRDRFGPESVEAPSPDRGVRLLRAQLRSGPVFGVSRSGGSLAAAAAWRWFQGHATTVSRRPRGVPPSSGHVRADPHRKICFTPDQVAASTPMSGSVVKLQTGP